MLTLKDIWEMKKTNVDDIKLIKAFEHRIFSEGRLQRTKTFGAELKNTKIKLHFKFHNKLLN